MRRRKLLLSLLTIFSVLLFSLSSLQRNEAKSFHSPHEKSFLEKMERGPLRNGIDSGQYFLGSVRCQGCHGFDTLHHSNVDANGVDINLYDDWESSMMANSAKDPLWRAKVSHEILVDAGHSLELQTKCTSCHAPMGHFTAMYHGDSSYTIAELENDTLGLNGVACGGCHEIGTQNLGSVFSGDIPYDTSLKEYGPFLNPFAGPMQLYEGFTPTFSDHMGTSQVCSSCHTLISKTVDLNGNYNGHTFVEQATYHEWLNSIFSQDNGTVCQGCHMPQITDSVIIANNILSLGPRSPFNQHQFAGANYFMVQMIRNNKASLKITAPDADFDSTLIETYRMLTQKAVSAHIYLDSISEDTAFLRMNIKNIAGHKFPSGYPSRRAVVQLVILDANGDTVFQSGMFDSSHEVKNIDPVFEQHHNVITKGTQSQIYEMIMGDVNGNVTTLLERADHFLKDNRIPPEGFITAFPSYDTTKIVGDAEFDPDFNKTNGTEGSGSDDVHYHIPLSGMNGSVSAYAKIFYQSVPPRWVQDMFTFSSPEIDTFKKMYGAADQAPIVVAHDSILSISIPTYTTDLGAYHDLSILHSLTDASVTIENKNGLMVYDAGIYNTSGVLLSSVSIQRDTRLIVLQLPRVAGIYFLKLRTSAGTIVFKTAKTL